MGGDYGFGLYACWVNVHSERGIQQDNPEPCLPAEDGKIFIDGHTPSIVGERGRVKQRAPTFCCLLQFHLGLNFWK